MLSNVYCHQKIRAIYSRILVAEMKIIRARFTDGIFGFYWRTFIFVAVNHKENQFRIETAKIEFSESDAFSFFFILPNWFFQSILEFSLRGYTRHYSWKSTKMAIARRPSLGPVHAVQLIKERRSTRSNISLSGCSRRSVYSLAVPSAVLGRICGMCN